MLRGTLGVFLSVIVVVPLSGCIFGYGGRIKDLEEKVQLFESGDLANRLQILESRRHAMDVELQELGSEIGVAKASLAFINTRSEITEKRVSRFAERFTDFAKAVNAAADILAAGP